MHLIHQLHILKILERPRDFFKLVLVHIAECLKLRLCSEFGSIWNWCLCKTWTAIYRASIIVEKFQKHFYTIELFRNFHRGNHSLIILWSQNHFKLISHRAYFLNFIRKENLLSVEPFLLLLELKSFIFKILLLLLYIFLIFFQFHLLKFQLGPILFYLFNLSCNTLMNFV